MSPSPLIEIVEKTNQKAKETIITTDMRELVVAVEVIQIDMAKIMMLSTKRAIAEVVLTDDTMIVIDIDNMMIIEIVIADSEAILEVVMSHQEVVIAAEAATDAKVTCRY